MIRAKELTKHFKVHKRPPGFGNALKSLVRRKLIADRIASLTQLAQVGAHLLEAMLEGESVDALPLKTLGELAKKT